MANTRKMLNEIMREVKNDPICDIVENKWSLNIIETGVPYLVSKIFETATLFASSNEGLICPDEIKMNGICEFGRVCSEITVKPGTIIKRAARKYKYDSSFIILKFIKDVEKGYGEFKTLYCILESVISAEYGENYDDTAIVTLYIYTVLFLKYATITAVNYAKNDGMCRIPIKNVVDLVITHDINRDRYKAEFKSAKGFRKAIKAGEKYADEQRQLRYQELWNTP